MNGKKVAMYLLALALLLAPGAAILAAEADSIVAEAANSDFSIDSDGVLTEYRGVETHVKIPENVTSIGDRAFYDCTSMTSVEIPNGVTSIGAYAFYNCTSMTSVEMPDGMTSIGKYAFYNCTSLTSVEIPDGVTSIEDHAFYNCTGLKQIKIPNSVLVINRDTFYNCASLFSITIPSGVTQICDDAFSQCTALTNVTIPASVKSFAKGIFTRCSDRMTIYGESGSKAEAYARSNGILFAPIGSKMTSVGWNQDGDHWWYCHEDGSYTKKGWEQIDGARYHFDSHGWRETGWHEIEDHSYWGKSYYYFDENGALVTNTWFGDSYVDEEGILATSGWRTIDGKRYHFDSNSKKSVGWHEINDWRYEGVYYFDENGVMVSSAWADDCYLDENGIRVANKWKDIDGKRYHFGSNGKKEVGWQWLWTESRDDYCRFYFDESGAMARNTWIGDNYVDENGKWVRDAIKVTGRWIQSDGRWWYQNADGSYPANCWQLIDGTWYYFDASGWMVTGWLQEGDTFYYLSENGAMQTGWQQVDGTWYYMYSDGSMAANTEVDGYYLDASGAWVQGVSQGQNGNSSSNSEGWVQSGNRWWYRHADGGYTTNGWEYINGKWYYFDASGWMVTGWQQVNGTWYYMDANGAMTTGWQQVNGIWYFLDDSGVMQTGWQQVNGIWYFLDDSGAMQTGWQEIGGTWYFLYEDGSMATDTYVGDYYVNASGAWVQ